jgi:hypothetical protein
VHFTQLPTASDIFLSRIVGEELKGLSKHTNLFVQNKLTSNSDQFGEFFPW